MKSLVEDYNRKLPKDNKLEKRLTASIQTKNFVTLAELREIVEWKFDGDGQKLPRLLRLLDKADDGEVKELSSTALSKATQLSDLARVRILDEEIGRRE